MRYFVTGHTGFKGSWLTMMLQSAGHEVVGYALDPEPGSLFAAARLGELMEGDIRADIRDPQALTDAVRSSAPDVVVHLAAQPLVLAGYRDPRTTYETNVMGTSNVLDAIEASASVRASLIITTDKVYANDGSGQRFKEGDPLGAHDPYSTSKAMADLLAQTWRSLHPDRPAAILRAGNVIGGGDHAADRLIPDVIRAASAGVPVSIRRPGATRPWQHVLDCLNGYVHVAELLVGDQPGRGAGAWNVGPVEDPWTVLEVVEAVGRSWPKPFAVSVDERASTAPEAAALSLDPQALLLAGWKPRLDQARAVAWVVRWYSDVARGVDPRAATQRQIQEFAECADSEGDDQEGTG